VGEAGLKRGVAFFPPFDGPATAFLGLTAGTAIFCSFCLAVGFFSQGREWSLSKSFVAITKVALKQSPFSSMRKGRPPCEKAAERGTERASATAMMAYERPW
jgi:hypothetical protein